MKQLLKMKIAVLGGGRREEALLQYMVEMGARVVALSKPSFPIKGIQVVESLAALLEGATILLAPASGIDENGRIREPFGEDIIFDHDFFAMIEEGSLLFMGYAGDGLKERLKEEPITLIEYLLHKEVATLNAIPTAEGAIKLALEGMSTTIQGSKTLVLGLGRVGLALAWRLKALNASLLGANRSKEGLFKGVEMGLQVIPLKEIDRYLGEVSLLFNTIPSLVLDRHRLHLLTKEALLLDLASAPGGIDFEAAKDLHLKASLYPGIPGLFFPEKAASILKDTLPSIIEEEVMRAQEVR